MQNKDPYSEFLNMMRSQGKKDNPPTIQTGEVISPLPNLAIKIGDLQLDKSDIFLADYLAGKDVLQKGDRLAVLSAGDNLTYVVLCRVVNLNE